MARAQTIWPTVRDHFVLLNVIFCRSPNSSLLHTLCDNQGLMSSQAHALIRNERTERGQLVKAVPSLDALSCIGSDMDLSRKPTGELCPISAWSYRRLVVRPAAYLWRNLVTYNSVILPISPQPRSKSRKRQFQAQQANLTFQAPDLIEPEIRQCNTEIMVTNPYSYFLAFTHKEKTRA